MFRIDPSGLAFAAGDELEITGTINQFFGFTQLEDAELRVIGPSALPAPVTLSLAQLLREAESHEAKLVRIVGAALVAPRASWDTMGMGSGTNYEITDGTAIVTMRLWLNTGFHGTPTPPSGFDLVAVLGQRAPGGRTATADGYQLWPRTPADLTPRMVTPFDVGGAPDVGSLDGGTSADASPPDFGSSGDAAVADAGGAGFDAAPSRSDSGANAAGGGSMTRTDSGCSCDTRGHGSPAWLLLGALILLRRRR